MRAFGLEVVSFADVLCQMSDLVKPAVPGRITLRDMLRPDRVKLVGVLFNALFNLSKFQAFEARDPVLVKSELNSGGITQWDRYAQVRRACVRRAYMIPQCQLVTPTAIDPIPCPRLSTAVSPRRRTRTSTRPRRQQRRQAQRSISPTATAPRWHSQWMTTTMTSVAS